MEAAYQKYKDQAEFFFIYVKEAHPGSGIADPKNGKIKWSEPQTFLERQKLAARFVNNSNCTAAAGRRGRTFSIPILVDDMLNTVKHAFDVKHDRLYVIDKEGKVGYQGPKSATGFDPRGMEIELKKLLGQTDEDFVTRARKKSGQPRRK